MKQARFILIILIFNAVSTHSQDNSVLTAKADTAYLKADWQSAFVIYTELIKSSPESGRLLFRAGVCSQKLGNYDDAIKLYAKAVQIGANPVVMYNLATAYCLDGQKDYAFMWLDKSIENGFSDYKGMGSDDDLKSIREEPKFNELVKRAKANAEPCTSNDEYRQFDFWIGEWTVTSGGYKVGESSIQLILDGCVILENWTGMSGRQGKSFNSYDAVTKKWKQNWVDDNGKAADFIDGIYNDGKMQFHTENVISKDGSQNMRRLTFFNLGDNQVRQFSELSSDGGATWKTEYDFLYTRKNENK